MIDIETAGTNKDACILTVGAQIFDPFVSGYSEQSYYARIDIDSQPNRSIDQSTIDWWSQQPPGSLEEAIGGKDRKPLQQVLIELSRFIFHCDHVWANGISFDMNILEDAYKSYKIALPWKYYRVRDARTIYALYPGLEKLPASHNSLEDCQRQIRLLQKTISFLQIKTML
jgi:hypothetical protein